MSMPAAPAPAAPSRWDVFLTASIPIAGLVVAIATIIISYQISRISDLAGDIKSVNSRVDQIYPLIAQSTADIGYIKGSLESTTQKIANAAEKNEALTKQLSGLISNQEAQVKNIQDIGKSINNLASSIGIQQQQLEEIKRKINFNRTNINKENFFVESTIFSPKDLVKIISQNLTDSEVVPIDWSDRKAVSNFFQYLNESNIDFNKVVVSTKDPIVVKSIRGALLKSGLSPPDQMPSSLPRPPKPYP